MSDEEDSNASQENEEEENEEEGENEEGEDDEGEDEEGEDDEDGEDDEEGSEEDEDDDDKDKKKGKKNKKKDGDVTKFEDNKLVEKSEIKLDVPIGGTNDFFDLSNLPVRPKSLVSILEEINKDMDTLTNQLNTTFSRSSYSTPYYSSVPIIHNVDAENEEIKRLIAQASRLSSEIDANLQKGTKSEDKCVGSDDEDDNNYRQTSEGNTPFYGTEPRQQNYHHNIQQSRSNHSPRNDPNRNREYYAALDERNRGMNHQYYNTNANNDNYSFPLNSTGTNRFQSSRVKKMDDLYSGDGLNKMPIIYSQEHQMNSNPNRQYNTHELKSNQDRGGYGMNMEENQKNNYYYEDMQQQPVNQQPFSQGQSRPFERFKPKNISHAMDILLDKQ